VSASTVLEIVRMGASAIGAVLSLLALFLSFREAKRVSGREPSTRDEMFQQVSDTVGANGSKVRMFLFLAIQAGMLVVAKQAYDVMDDPSTPISPLALSSNLNQIFVIGVVTLLSVWEYRDLSSRQKIERMASFVPQRRASKRSRRAEIVDIEEDE
jgi:hypothetical protein